MSAPSPMTTDPLQEEFFLTDAARLRRWLPWLHLPTALRMACDPRKVILAMVALVLLALPALLRQGFDEDSITEAHRLPWSAGVLFRDLDEPLPSAEAMLANPLRPVHFAVSQGPQVLTPVTQVLHQGRSLVEAKFRWGRTSLGIVEILWTWAVWAVFGTFICRLAALDFLGRDVGWSEAWRFCRSRVGAAFTAPLLPLVGVLGLWIPCLIAGWITRIPAIGEPLVAVGWVLVWGCGAGLALLLLGLTLCWPLMIATVGVEGTDAFDGLSRSYNYLFSRPWYLLWMVLIALVVGGGGLFAARWLAAGAETLALQSFAAGANDVTVSQFQPHSPLEGISAEIVQFWHRLIRLGIHAFAHSYFWTAVTVIFLLLRKSVDSTPLDQLGEDRRPSIGELPLAGIPAAERREKGMPPSPVPPSP